MLLDTSLPSEGRLSWVQTTAASAASHESSQTVPHWLLKQISTRPSVEFRPSVQFRPPRSLISPSWQGTRNLLNQISYTIYTKTEEQPNCTYIWHLTPTSANTTVANVAVVYAKIKLDGDIIFIAEWMKSSWVLGMPIPVFGVPTHRVYWLCPLIIIFVLPRVYYSESVQLLSIPAIWIGWRRQSAVNIVSCENTAVKRQAFCYSVHIANVH